jgi:ubiquinone/menaquinone biosynthesis C-methylase UbiE
MEAPLEWCLFASWRSRLRGRIVGERVLEVGVGTGKNILYYPDGVNITAIDFSPLMLQRAQKKASVLGTDAEFQIMDVQNIEFPDHYFDTIFATFVFCSVPDPILGLQEVRRVCKHDGRLILLEHMRPANPVLGLIFDAVNPIVVRTMGANINRRTLDNILKAGWKILETERLSSDIVQWIEAEPC